MSGGSAKSISRCFVALIMLHLGCEHAAAFMHAGGFGVATGNRGSWGAVGYRGGTASGGGGSWNATGARGGTASGGGGSWSATGAYGGTASGGGGTWHATNAYGTTVWGSAGGAYYGGVYSTYHPPTVVNDYAPGCVDCGGWSAAGAAAVGAPAADGATGSASAAADDGTSDDASDSASQAEAHAGVLVTGPNPEAASAPPDSGSSGAIVPVLPAGCITEAAGGEGTFYECQGTWYKPSYGANGVYYRVVPAP